MIFIGNYNVISVPDLSRRNVTRSAPVRNTGIGHAEPIYQGQGRSDTSATDKNRWISCGLP